MALERKGGERVEFEREGCSVVVVIVVVVVRGGGGGVNGVVVVSTLRRESSEGGDSHGGGMMLARRCRLRRRASQRGMLLRYGGWRGGIGPYMKKGGEVNYCQFERSLLKILQTKRGKGEPGGGGGGRGGFFSWAFFAAKWYMVFLDKEGNSAFFFYKFFIFNFFLTRYLQHGTKTQVVIECHSPLGAPGLRVAVVV